MLELFDLFDNLELPSGKRGKYIANHDVYVVLGS